MKSRPFYRFAAVVLCALMLLSLPPYDGVTVFRAFAEQISEQSEVQTSETAEAEPSASPQEDTSSPQQPGADSQQPSQSDGEPAAEQDAASDKEQDAASAAEQDAETPATPENAIGAPLRAPQRAPQRSVASYTLSLRLDGGVLEGLPEAGWTLDSETDQWTCSMTETAAGAGVSLTLGQPNREGYVFDGWEAGEGAAQQQDGGWLVTGDTTFTARWLPVATPGTALLDLNSTQTVTITARKWSNTNNSYSLVLSHADTQTMPDSEALVNALNRTANGLQLSYTYTTPEGITKEKTADFSINWTDSQLDALLVEMKEDVDDHNINGNIYTITLPDDYLAGLIAAQEELTAEEIQLAYNTAFSQGVQLVVTLGAAQSVIQNKEQYEIQTVDPQNVTFNLFDYWVTDRLISDQISDSNIYQFNLFQSGVNEGHGLIFRKNSASGKWNAWTDKTGGVRKGIVQNNLQGDYPVLNLKNGFGASGNWEGTTGTYEPEESLEYLFNPTKVKEGNYGRAYSTVTGLLKIADNGNYYYSSHDNFAEFNEAEKRFNVYNTWGVKKSGTSPDGQFFPFNSAEEVFDLDSNGQLTQKSNITSKNDLINHYLGLTMEAEFQQPLDGMVSVGTSAKPMVFDFSGDDDVWIFIDGVLVADLGGIHDEMKVSIDFSTGAIHVERAYNPNDDTTWDTTLKDQFDAAENTSISFDGNTFAGNTVHTLKMFYLERGNTDSNLTLSFNLMEPVDSELIKLDQNGEPVQGAGFSLYEAAVDEAGQPILEDGSYRVGTPIAENLTSDKDGHCTLPKSYDFSQHTYYVLRETTIPLGYFSTGDVLLRYDRFEEHPDGTSSGTNLLLVENRWTTGAVSNFVAQVSQAGTLHYDDGGEISLSTGQDGLILAVPLLKSTAGDWLPLYGSNLTGYHAVEYDPSAGDAEARQRKAILTAALRQIYGAGQDEDLGYRRWYLEWNEKNQRYQGTLVDLPGDASRYYWASGSVDADMSAAYYFLDLGSLKELFDTATGMDTTQKLDAVYQAIQKEADADTAIQQLVEKILSQDQKTFGLLDVGAFNRTFASRIYVPDVKPELGVQKLDSDGNPLKGVEFTLYRGSEATGTGIASGTTDEKGLLIFSQTVEDGPGTAKAVLTQGNYILKETKPPEGYEPKTQEIPVYVTPTGRVYADALEQDDGITVRKGLGKLLQTMVRYASDGSVNVTLRDISASLVTADTVAELPSAEPTGEPLRLHYGLSNALLEYGTHEVDGVAPNPYFEVDTDYAGIQIKQNYHAHEGDNLYSAVVAKTNLEDTDIRGLFTGSTTVVVRNRMEDEKGKFSLRKTVSGDETDPDAIFPFEVSVTESSSETWTDTKCDYTVTDAEGGELESGTLIFTKGSDNEYWITSVTPSSQYVQQKEDKYQIQLKADQKIEVEGLPFGATVKAREVDNTGYTTQVSVNNGEWTAGTEASGAVEKPIGNPAFQFHNHKEQLTKLVLKKVVTGTQSDDTKFPFTIRLTDSADSAPLAGSYSFTVTYADGTLLSSGTITDGTLEIRLGNEDTLAIEDLPVGAKYLITETPMGFTPTVTVNGEDKQAVNNSISGQLKKTTDEVTTVVFTNSRTGSITITKRDGVGNLLSGAGFTLYTVDAQGNKTQYRTEQRTALAMNVEVQEDDRNFDQDAMRYTDGTNSYTVHTTKDNGYFYYRFLSESERQQYYNGTLQNSDRVEAVVQFTDLPLENTYAVEETTVPDGYVQNADFEATMGEIRLGGSAGEGANPVYDILYTVTNHRKLVLPTAGQMGIAPTLMMGVLLLAAAALLLWTANRKPRRAGPRHPTP